MPHSDSSKAERAPIAHFLRETHTLGAQAHERLKALAERTTLAKEPLETIQRGLPVVNTQMDRFFASAFDESPEEVQCKAGCGACCHQWIRDVKHHEVHLIGRWILESGDKDAIEEELAHQVSVYEALASSVKDEAALQREYGLRKIPCVFLSPDHRCSIHSIRPYACRTFFSFSAPKYCEAEALDSDENRSFILEPHAKMDKAYEALDEALVGRSEALEMIPALLTHLRRDPSNQDKYYD